MHSVLNSGLKDPGLFFLKLMIASVKVLTLVNQSDAHTKVNLFVDVESVVNSAIHECAHGSLVKAGSFGANLSLRLYLYTRSSIIGIDLSCNPCYLLPQPEFEACYIYTYNRL